MTTTPRRDGVRLSEIVAAIALASDLGIGQPLDHVLRSCVIATRFATELKLSDEDRDAAYWATLFMTAGCTGVSYEMSQIFGDDIAFRAGVFSVGASNLSQLRYILAHAGSDQNAVRRFKVRADLITSRMSILERTLVAHCAISAILAERLQLGPTVATALRQTFTRWDGKGLPRGIGGEDILLPIRIANIANIVEVRHREQGIESCRQLVRDLRGTRLDPSLADAWVEMADRILDGINEESSWERVIANEPVARGSLTEDEIDAAFELIADYADLKSPWFAGHSRGVASLAAAAARAAGLPAGDVITLRRAALVHDIGRNGIPNTIWDKPGPLTDGEWERVRLHAYYTDRVMRRSGHLAHLGAIASAAHERSGGTGYPKGIAGATIPLLGRFLEAADAYHAMGEDRPHRAALPPEQAKAELQRGVRAGEFDGAAVDAVLTAAGHPVRRRPSTPGGLTAREVEVLGLAARGGTSRVIAAKLGVTPKTVGNHLERIYAKIGISTRAEAAMYAMQQGLVPDWESPRL